MTDRIVDGRLKSTIVRAELDAHIVAVEICHGKILFAVAVKVSGQHREWSQTNRVRGLNCKT